jgi:hypothetical protein
MLVPMILIALKNARKENMLSGSKALVAFRAFLLSPAVRAKTWKHAKQVLDATPLALLTSPLARL